jgi:hypothetical protein
MAVKVEGMVATVVIDEDDVNYGTELEDIGIRVGAVD